MCVDLGATATISQVKFTWEAACGVETSANGMTWTPICSTTAGDDLAGTGRYVRISARALGTVYGYSLFEVQVCGTA